MINSDEIIWLSPSAVTRFFECKCPAAWLYSQMYSKKEGIPQQIGKDAHAKLEGKDISKSKTASEGERFAQKLEEGQATLDVEIENNAREQYESFPFPGVDGVQWVRVIDVMAKMRPDGERVILDYKTGKEWKPIYDKEGNEIYPLAHGFQSAGYLIPPVKPSKEQIERQKTRALEQGLQWKPKPKGWYDAWPTMVIYIVASWRKEPVIAPYHLNQADLDNLREAIKLIQWSVLNKNLPKIRGHHCHDCHYRRVCYNELGWKYHYEKRSHFKEWSQYMT